MKPQFQRWIEGKAEGMRKKCKLGPFDKLDPFELAEKMSVTVIGPFAIDSLDPEILSLMAAHQLSSA